MKRLITILIIFSVLIGFCVIEIVYKSNFFSEEIGLLNQVEIRFNEDEENISRQETVSAFDLAYSKWEKNKKTILMLSNHNCVKFLDEKMVALKELIRMNQQYDAYVALKTAICYLEELNNESLPTLPNLL